MVTRTGLDVQFAYKGESTVGTAVTVDKAIQIYSEGIEFDPAWKEPEGLRAGQNFKRGTLLVQTRKQVGGSFEIPYMTRSMGGLWRAALGSAVTTPTLVAGTAYKQVHQVGDLLGKSLTLQVTRPEVAGTVPVHTFNGCKVTDWEWSVAEGDVAKFKLGIDAWDESTATALAAAAYVDAAQHFHFIQGAVFTLGGTVSGTTELSISGGTAIAPVVKSISIKGQNGLDVDRIPPTAGGTKKEQLETGMRMVTIDLDAEYDRTTFYDVFKAGTATPFQLRFDGAVIGAGPDKDSIEFTAPEIRIKQANPSVSGPEIVRAKVQLEAYIDPANRSPFQVKLVSADSTSII